MTDTDTATSEAPVTTDRAALETALHEAGERCLAASTATEQAREPLKEAALDAIALGWNEKSVATLTGVTRQTVRNWQGKIAYATGRQQREATRAMRDRTRTLTERAPRSVEAVEQQLAELGETYRTARAELVAAQDDRETAGLAALSAGFLGVEVEQIGQVTNKVIQA